MNRHPQHKLGTVGMDYNKHPAIIETSPPQPIPSIPQSPHPSNTSYCAYSYPSTTKSKISKSKRFQKD